MQTPYIWTTLALVATIFLEARVVTSSPLDVLLDEFLGASDEDAAGDNEPDIHYDQRQSGTENYRLTVDGLVIAAPAASEDAIGSFGLIATNYMANLAAATSAMDEQHEEGDDGDANAKPYDFEAHHDGDAVNDKDGAKPAPGGLDLWQFKNGPNLPGPDSGESSPLASGERLQLRSKSSVPITKNRKK